MAHSIPTTAPPPERLHWEQRYTEGPRPWDTRITPPEVEAFWADESRAKSGLALDLGCGPGTNVAYLARLGLTAVGIDLAGRALLQARARLESEPPPLRRRIAFIHADVARLPFRRVEALYILDIGCLHGIPAPDRPAYAASVVANLSRGGHYHLYAFDRPAGDDTARRGMGEHEVADLFASHLRIVQEERARPDRHPCRWYLFVKP